MPCRIPIFYHSALAKALNYVRKHTINEGDNDRFFVPPMCLISKDELDDNDAIAENEKAIREMADLLVPELLIGNYDNGTVIENLNTNMKYRDVIANDTELKQKYGKLLKVWQKRPNKDHWDETAQVYGTRSYE